LLIVNLFQAREKWTDIFMDPKLATMERLSDPEITEIDISGSRNHRNG